MNTSTLFALSDADLDAVSGGAIGDPIPPVTPTIVCPVGQTYDPGTGKCGAPKLQMDGVEVIEL